MTKQIILSLRISQHTVLICLFLFVIIFAIRAQNASVNEAKTEKKIQKELKASKKADKMESGALMVTPVLAPGYTPELGGLVVGGAMVSFKTKLNDSTIQRSSLPITVSYSTTGAIVFNAILKSYWINDKLRVFGNFWIKDMPDHYWGVGYEKGYEVPKSDSTTLYNRLWWWINPQFMLQVKENLFVGLNVDYNYTRGSSPASLVANDPVYQTYNNRPHNSGLGFILRYDSRDMPVDAHSGLFIDFMTTFYNPKLGGDNTYQIYLLDYRQFKTIKRQGITLALQAEARFGVGDVPYGEMSQLGTPFDFRGYQWGRYRDKSMLFFLAEMRYFFLKRNHTLSKHGLVGWLGEGTIFNFDASNQAENRWLPNAGVGYRFEIQPRMHIRIDYGVGRETTGFYFNFNQAF